MTSRDPTPRTFARSAPAGVRQLDRRRFLKLAGAGGAGVVLLSGAARTLARRASAATYPWTDPTVWGGRVPGPRDVAVISSATVVLDTDVTVAGLLIRPGGRLVFDGNRTLTSTGNVVVEGGLSMRPNGDSTVHRLVFQGVREGSFVGGGHEVLASDVGLWVRDDGVLDAAGTPKLAWTRAASDIPAGATSVTLVDAPDGWRPGDEVLLVPTAAGQSAAAFEVRTVASVDQRGRRVTFTSGTGHPHPSVTLPDGRTLGPEVVNLTRNVRIEGTPSGRSHVHIHAMSPQRISHVALRHLGPAGVLGRYALHFHHSGEGSRGSVVEGVVARDIGNHSFVPHASHGITFRDCVAFNFTDDAYWWDREEPDGTTALTNDARFERCLALLGTSTGFTHQFGAGNAAVNCVVAGVRDPRNGFGYFWPAGPPGTGTNAVWTWSGNVAHHCREGVRVWQNTAIPHVVDDVVSYHNDTQVFHGAYRNPYVYRGGAVLGRVPVEIHAVAAAAGQDWSDLALDAGGTGAALRIIGHSLAASRPARLLRWRLSGHPNGAAVEVDERGPQPGAFDLVECTTGGRDLEPGDFRILRMHPSTVIRVQRRNRTAFQVTSSGSRTIPPFA